MKEHVGSPGSPGGMARYQFTFFIVRLNDLSFFNTLDQNALRYAGLPTNQLDSLVEIPSRTTISEKYESAVSSDDPPDKMVNWNFNTSFRFLSQNADRIGIEIRRR